MKTFILFIALLLGLSGGTITAQAEDFDFVPLCPKEDAYIHVAVGEYEMYFAIKVGDVSALYNRMGKSKFIEDAHRYGLPYDFKKCPPVDGHLRARNGMAKNLPMGFFDDPDNYLDTDEWEEEKKNRKKKKGVTAHQ